MFGRSTLLYILILREGELSLGIPKGDMQGALSVSLTFYLTIVSVHLCHDLKPVTFQLLQNQNTQHTRRAPGYALSFSFAIAGKSQVIDHRSESINQ